MDIRHIYYYYYNARSFEDKNVLLLLGDLVYFINSNNILLEIYAYAKHEIKIILNRYIYTRFKFFIS